METNPGFGPNTRGKQTTIEESQPQNPSGRKPLSGDMSGLLSEIHAKLGKLDQLDEINRKKVDNFQVIYETRVPVFHHGMRTTLDQRSQRDQRAKRQGRRDRGRTRQASVRPHQSNDKVQNLDFLVIG